MKRAFILIVCSAALAAQSVLSGCGTQEDDNAVQADEEAMAARRAELVAEGIAGWGIEDPQVIEVLSRVPRHEFVPEKYAEMAYNNAPLPIGFGQTISQPYIVALMTQELDLEPDCSVLEIGTGSGYQAAVLAEMGCEVFTVEVINELSVQAVSRLEELGYERVHFLNADGYFGWEEHGPYDRIMVTAAPDHVPQPLLEQLTPGGIMIIPVGPVGGYQELWKITLSAEGRVQSRSLGGVRFVPLVSEAGRTTDQQLP